MRYNMLIMIVLSLGRASSFPLFSSRLFMLSYLSTYVQLGG